MLNDCPPGLEYLAQVNCIMIHQQSELLEALTGFEGANKYDVLNSFGQRIYTAVESKFSGGSTLLWKVGFLEA